MKEDVATMVAHPRGERRGVLRLRLDHQRIPQGGLGDLPLSGRPPQAMRRKGRLPVRRGRDLGVLSDVIVGAGHDTDAVPVGVVRELPEIRSEEHTSELQSRYVISYA